MTYPTLSSPAPCRTVTYRTALSRPVLTCPVLSCPVPTRLLLSCPVLQNNATRKQCTWLKSTRITYQVRKLREPGHFKNVKRKKRSSSSPLLKHFFLVLKKYEVGSELFPDKPENDGFLRAILKYPLLCGS